MLFVTLKSSAQTTLVPEPPAVILFMLHISTNTIESLQKKGLTDEVRSVMQADSEINRSIVRDFEKVFTFCPVYFFYDTQLHFVKRKQWDGVHFFDYEHFKSNKKIEVSGFGDYLIAEVNYPPATEYPTIDSLGKIHYPEYTVDYANGRDYGVICYDENYNLLRNKLQYTNVSLRQYGNMFKPESMHYRFVGALIFQEKLKKFYLKKTP
jgi:hypothetical protein